VGCAPLEAEQIAAAVKGVDLPLPIMEEPDRPDHTRYHLVKRFRRITGNIDRAVRRKNLHRPCCKQYRGRLQVSRNIRHNVKAHPFKSLLILKGSEGRLGKRQRLSFAVSKDMA
jgi:hypothetical protein